MTVLLLLIPLSLMLLVVMIGAFVWAVRNGQFDDLDTPPLDVLSDRQPEMPSSEVAPEAGRDER
jgi:cbb3-type cytochrome oxidase maturation protein